MAIKTHLTKQEEAISENAIQVRSSDPGSPVEDQLWYNSTEKKIKIRKSSTTETISDANASVFEGVDYTNFVINGGFRFDQEREGLSQYTGTLNGYTLDQWFAWGGNSGWAVGQGTISDPQNWNSKHYVSVNRQDGSSATDVMAFGQAFEESVAMELQGQQMTLSFYVQPSAGFSPASGTLSLLIRTHTSEVNVAALSVTSSSTSWNLTPGASWSKKTYTFTVPTNIKGLGFYFSWIPTGTASTDNIAFAEVVLKKGSSAASKFVRAGKTVEGELALCQRFYEKSYTIGTAVGSSVIDGEHFFNTSSVESYPYHTVRFTTAKRASPTVTLINRIDASTGNIRYYGTGAKTTAIGYLPSTGSFIIYPTVAPVANTVYETHWIANARI